MILFPLRTYIASLATNQKIKLATQFYSYAGKSVLRGVLSTHAHTDVARSLFH